MKSYLLNNYRANTWEKSPSVSTSKDLFKKQYRNLVDETSFGATGEWRITELGANYYGTWGVTSDYPALNILEDTNTKEVRFDCEKAQGSDRRSKVVVPIVLNKSTTDSFNSVYIKLNKLNPLNVILANHLKSNGNVITVYFHDETSGFLGSDGDIILTGMTAPASPMSTKTKILNQRNYDYETGALYISPEEMAEMGFTDRSSNASSSSYHMFITLVFNFISTPELIRMPYLGISNMIVTTAIEVDIENNPDLSYENKTKLVKNIQGVAFKDIYNIVRKLKIRLPLLSAEEYISLDTNFLQKNFNGAFALIALGNSGTLLIEDYENKRFTGFYMMESPPDVERLVYNVYNVELDLIEVI